MFYVESIGANSGFIHAMGEIRIVGNSPVPFSLVLLIQWE
jgi:hypothetical protein